MFRVWLNFMRELQNIFLSSCPVPLSHQQCARILGSPHPYQSLVLLVFLILASVMGVQCDHTEGLICTDRPSIDIDTITTVVRHIFMCLLNSCTFTYLHFICDVFVQSFVPCSLFFSFYFWILGVLYILHCIFFHQMACPFILLIEAFYKQEF